MLTASCPMQMKASNLGNSEIDSEIYHVYWIYLSFAKWARRDFAANVNFLATKPEI